MKKLTTLSKNDKPREKLLKKGAKALKDYELIAILLGSGIKGKDVFALSKEIAKLFENDFENLYLEKLLNINGVGLAKASQIISAIELSRRYLIKQNKKVTSPQDIFNELKEFSTKKQEHFILVTLDGASHIINTHTIFIGTLNQSIVHPREVFATAIEERAANIIIAHNHPSNTLAPSQADINITKRLKEVAKLVGIELLDHIILTKDGYYSFSDEGLI